MAPQVFNVPGRCYPVDIIHSIEDHQRDYVDAAADVVLQVHIQQPLGEKRGGLASICICVGLYSCAFVCVCVCVLVCMSPRLCV